MHTLCAHLDVQRSDRISNAITKVNEHIVMQPDARASSAFD